MKLFNTKKYFIILFILLVSDCAIGGFIASWRSWFWQSVSDKNIHGFFIYTEEFSIAALLSGFVTGCQSYLVSVLALNYRTILTKKALDMDIPEVEGRGQRIQDDCLSYPTLLLTLTTGVIKSLIMIVVFAYILIIQLPLLYLLFPFIYTALGTGIAAYIAKPLIALNYMNQVFEAKFRQLLTQLSPLTKTGYINAHRNNFNLFKRTKYLAYFQSFYNQITVIIPYLGLSFLYFSGKISFGIFMQVASSMIEIINNLSFLINSFNDINRLLSCRKRLKEIKVI